MAELIPKIDRETMARILQRSELIIAQIGVTLSSSNDPSAAFWRNGDYDEVSLVRSVEKHEKGTILDNYSLTSGKITAEYSGPEGEITRSVMHPDLRAKYADLDPASVHRLAILGVLATAPVEASDD